jgi:RNA polymerase-associated protein RTF1
MERSRLTQVRTLALRRHDYGEVEKIDAELALFTTTIESANTRPKREESVTDMLARVNDRNRRANIEAVRQSELIAVERKRKARLLAATTGSPVPQDPSTRLKTIPRTFNAATPSSRSVFVIIIFGRCVALVAHPIFIFAFCIPRPGTPSIVERPSSNSQESDTRPVSPLPPLPSTKLASPDKSKTFESAVIDSVEVDLGDF